MANTTNFGWETPDDTDLVKDGAAAIRTLGSAIDTSLVDLKGGTTGQVLSKTSNTDMDFTWATPVTGSLTLLSTTTFSGAAVNLTSISGSYKHLYLQWYGLTNATANAYLDMRLNNNSGSVYNTYRAIGAGNTTGAQAEDANTYLRTVSSNLDRTSANNAGNMFIYNYTSSTNYKVAQVNFGFRAPTANVFNITTCLFLSNTAVTQVNFFLDNGASFSSGTVELYGVN